MPFSEKSLQTEGNWRQLLKNCAIVSAREIKNNSCLGNPLTG